MNEVRSGDELSDLMDQWEGVGSNRIAALKIGSMNARINVVKEKGKYNVLRYFQINGKWCVSCDASNVSADDAFRALDRVMF